jgi:hypothetical protein
MIRNLEVGGQKITDTAGSGKLLTRECDTNVKNTVMNPFVEKMSVVFTVPGVGHVKIMKCDVLDDFFSLVNITL